MDIKILDSWLREIIDTDAKPKDIARCLSLSGPTVDRLKKQGEDWVYEIEVTPNRVDAMSVYGIARELSAILPNYGYKAKIKQISYDFSKTSSRKLDQLKLFPDKNLTYRLMGVVFSDIKNWNTPEWMKKRLETAGMRSLNSVVDITNYVMHEVGHPCHVFDYEKISTSEIYARLSKKNEKITTLENKNYTLSGGDIVLDDGKGNIIDLPGIIGLKNTSVTQDTKKVLLFMDTNDPSKIRKTSMELNIRTNAAVLNEKGVDPNLAEPAMAKAIHLMKSVCQAQITSDFFDKYAKKAKSKTIRVKKEFIENITAEKFDNKKIVSILEALGFSVKIIGKQNFEIKVPSYRLNDINDKQDIVEEVARVYGYHNLPSRLMATPLPKEAMDKKFERERRVKQGLVKLGGIEVYNLSLVSKENAGKTALKLKNPLGSETEYLRQSLVPSLLEAAEENKSRKVFHLFEVANVYQRKNKGELPSEIKSLAGIFKGYSYRRAKGIVEKFLEELNIEFKQKVDLEKTAEFRGAENYINFYHDKKNLVDFGAVGEFYFYKARLKNLIDLMRDYSTYQPPLAYPPQIEDITLKLDDDEHVGDIIEKINSVDKKIHKVSLKSIYENFYTFRVWYVDDKKTLTDDEVLKIRTKLLKKLDKKPK